MEFDKARTMRAAERFLTHGKISAAIAEYKQIVENDPDEVSTQNMLGDLYIKENDENAAIDCYKRAAEIYKSNGFEKKATAVYSKIHRLKPESNEIRITLAELYQTRGSMAEALAHYEAVASSYEKEGNKTEALTIWEKIAKIAPKNTEIYLKIAEFHLRNKRKSDACRAFIDGGVRLAENGKHEEAVAAFSNALEMKPEDPLAVGGFVNSQRELGYPEEAVKKLDEIYSKDPNNGDVISMLADCYLDMGDADKAGRILIDWITKEPKAYVKLLDVIDFYTKKDDTESAVSILSMISEQLLVSEKPERLLNRLNAIVLKNPGQIPALRLLVRYHDWHKENPELRRALDVLLLAANYQGLIEDERFALTQLLLLSPQEDKYISRLKKINGVEDSRAPDSESSDERQGGHIPPVDLFEGAPKGTARDEISILEPDPASENASTEADEIVLTDADLQTDVVPETVTSDSEETPELIASDGVESEGAEKTLDTAEQIENLRFYIDQGYVEIAEHTILELDEQYGVREEFEEIRKVLRGLGFDLSPKKDERVDSVDQHDPPDAGVEVENLEAETSTMKDNGESGFDFVFESTSGDVIGAQPDSSQDEASNEPTDPQGKADILVESDEKANESVSETVEDTALENEAGRKAETPSGIEEGAVSEVNEESATETEENIEEEPESEDKSEGAAEDYENHYHHAVAYKEMGLLGDAIPEFERALDCADAQDGSGRFLQCCILLGHCFLEQNSPKEAAASFKKAFNIEGLSEAEKMALNYELGSTYVHGNDFEKALSYFEELRSVDASYRDVAARIEECQEQLSLVGTH